MNAKAGIDKAGRIVLPKAVRQALRVGAGDVFEIEVEDDRLILSPIRHQPGLQKEMGVWVFRSGTPAETSISELIEKERNRRWQT